MYLYLRICVIGWVLVFVLFNLVNINVRYYPHASNMASHNFSSFVGEPDMGGSSTISLPILMNRSWMSFPCIFITSL